MSQPTTAVYGRELELTGLQTALNAVRNKQGRLVLIAGETGIGKTTLVETLERDARRAGALVLSGRCYDLVTTQPYGPWIELLRSYSPQGGLPELPPVLVNADVLDTNSGQDALFEEAAGFFFDIAERRPVLLVLEDQHWADQASLELLRFLSRQLSSRSILVVVTY